MSIELGLMDLDPDEVQTKRTLVHACERVIGVVDHSKWSRAALLPFAPTERIDALVTDSKAPLELLER
jgi:DeoR/GlpR family transcriptional regulator of sugar metabolism